MDTAVTEKPAVEKVTDRKVRKEEIAYKVYNNLYINLTNRCPCACTFCLRQNMDRVGESDSLWLDHEPTASEVLSAVKKLDPSKFNEIVFCGFGEPTEAFPVLVEVSDQLKALYPNPIRLNTNGLGCLINRRDICPDLKGRIDTVSISLNTPNAEEYNRLVRPKFGPMSFQAMLDFAREAKKYVPNVVMSTVSTTISKADEDRCAAICKELGVTYRIRPYES
ncbi:MAG: TatD family nuclease-associated radical SAM protein [Lachnospiraceae bacterium]|nr:TatD family nuclease-associated radical SAM protein [Lachnospiraceae bacterium]